jgi:hypothetical protein
VKDHIMATKVETKRINVSGTVTPELHEFIEEFRWSNRMSKSDVINAALVEWGGKHGFSQPEAGEGDAAHAAEAPKGGRKRAS